MNLLALETATENCSVAIECDGVIANRRELLPNGHSRRIHGMVRELTTECGISLSALDAIVADTGPGSFTGLRIGIGIAQGLAYAGGTQVIGVSSLAALAAACPGSFVISAIDARMGQVYWNLYDTRDGVKPLGDPLVSDPGTVAVSVEQKLSHSVSTDRPEISLVAAGTGWDAYPETMPEMVQANKVFRSQELYPDAVNLLTLAQAQGPAACVEPTRLAATYVRNEVAIKADAK